MTNKDAIIILKGIQRDIMPHDELSGQRTEDVAFNLAIKALENQESQIDLDEYKSRLVSKYSDGDEATDFDKGITMALDLLEEMEEEQS